MYECAQGEPTNLLEVKMTLARTLPLMVLALGMAAATPAGAYDNDEQALRLRDTVADPSVPLAWDRRAHPETWRYRYDGYDRDVRHCGKRYYWNGDECVKKRRR